MKTRKLISLSAIAALAVTLSPLSVHAQTVQIPVGQQAQDRQNLARPRAGMNQDQVKTQYGNPLDWTNPVGDPPITKWIYRDFIVVFEYDQVLHSVLVHTPQPGNNSGEQPTGNSDSESDALSILSQSTN